MSETFRCSEGIFGVKVNRVGWGARGMLEQSNECGGDCRTSCGDKGLVQAFMPLKATSDLLDDGDGREGSLPSGVGLSGESPS